eukprot:3682319-Prymnesium_polylepis.1
MATRRVATIRVAGVSVIVYVAGRVTAVRRAVAHGRGRVMLRPPPLVIASYDRGRLQWGCRGWGGEVARAVRAHLAEQAERTLPPTTYHLATTNPQAVRAHLVENIDPTTHHLLLVPPTTHHLTTQAVRAHLVKQVERTRPSTTYFGAECTTHHRPPNNPSGTCAPGRAGRALSWYSQGLASAHRAPPVRRGRDDSGQRRGARSSPLSRRDNSGRRWSLGRSRALAWRAGHAMRVPPPPPPLVPPPPPASRLAAAR